jgi:CheY-like chemotaxis protein
VISPHRSNIDQQSRKPKLSILVVEPEQDIQLIYQLFLKDWTAEIVDTGQKCIDIVSRQDRSFDMAIIDSHIKGIDAIETIQRIRKIVPHLNIVVTSTNTNEFMQKLKVAGIENTQVGDAGIIDVIQKPFSFMQLLTLLHSKVGRINKVGLTDHVLAIYEDVEEEFTEALAFLKCSIQNKETALFILRKDYDIELLKGKMRSSGINVDFLISNRSLIIIHNEDWYIPDKRVDKHKIIDQWKMLVENCTNSGKKGLRAFCMMDCFFEHNCIDEVVEYEYTLPAKFEMPFIPICAYRKQDIDMLSDDQKRRLVLCHSHVWTSNKNLL